MILGVFQTVEWISEAEAADDIEGREAEPCRKVDDRAFIQIKGEKFSNARMVGVVRIQDVVSLHTDQVYEKYSHHQQHHC